MRNKIFIFKRFGTKMVGILCSSSEVVQASIEFKKAVQLIRRRLTKEEQCTTFEQARNTWNDITKSNMSTKVFTATL